MNQTTLKGCFLFIVLFSFISQGNAQDKIITDYDQSLVDYEGFVKEAAEINEHRSKRLVNLDKFLALAEEENTIILDTRSRWAYDKKHIKGAIHLNFSDFGEKKLKEVIPSKTTRVLIYCNNNFLDDQEYFAAKAMTLALNIPTFINLYGYGYKNVYELSSLVSVNNDLLEFEGEAVK